uniref:Uncharacterized protein n=1 Tax=Meloidogyne floridensis TaxID=298350 RepID=A0A915NNV4_9BILA
MENNGGIEVKSELFNALKEKNGKSSFILHILETINEKIVDNIYSSLRKLKTKKGFSFTSLIKQSSVVQEDEILQKGLIQFFEPLIQAKYYALALTLKQIVMKENEKEEENIYENLNSIKLNISEEEINKISLIENNFVLIENSLKDLSGDLFEKLSGDTSDQFIPSYFDFRAVQISRNGENGTLATRLIEKIFNYATSPFDWIGKKAANSRNGVFQKVYGQLNSIVEFFRSFFSISFDILENASLVMDYYNFLQNYGTNIKILENNGGIEIKSKLFNALTEKNGKSSFILHILETINEKIVDNIYSSFDKLKTKKGFTFTSLIKQSSTVQEDETLQKELIKFFEPLIKAKYYALALKLKQIVMKENEKEESIYENLNSIKLNISEEEMSKINLIENNFVLIENALKDLSGDLFEKCNGMILQKLGYNKDKFVSQLAEEMNKIMWNLDFKFYGQLNSIVEFFRSFVLRKTPIENMFVQLYYHEKIRGKGLKGKILKVIGNFQRELSDGKTWKEIKKDFGELMKEIEILVKILNLKDEKPKDIEKMLKQIETKKESIQEGKKEEDDFSLDSDSFSEEIGKALKETINSFKKNAKEKENVEWTDIRSCAITKLQTLSTQKSTTLLRTKREDPVFLYHDRRYSVKTSNVFNFIGWYLIVGGSLWFGSSLLVLHIVSEWDPHCPVPVIHLSEMHLPEMHMPAFFHRRQNSPNIPQHTQLQPQHPPQTQFRPQQSNPNRADVEMGEVVWGYPVHDHFAAQQYQYRHRRNVKGTKKECLLNGGTCPNSVFISFHKDDHENSLFSVNENGCFKSFKNGDQKLRKKRNVFEIEWVECGSLIIMFWTIGVFVAWVVGAVFIGIHYF